MDQAYRNVEIPHPQCFEISASQECGRCRPCMGLVRSSRRKHRGSALTSVPLSPVLSRFESTNPIQGSGLAASLAPHSWHEHAGRTARKPQAPRRCLMSLRLVALLFPGPLHRFERNDPCILLTCGFQFARRWASRGWHIGQPLDQLLV
jgi:hypothetical protein